MMNVVCGESLHLIRDEQLARLRQILEILLNSMLPYIEALFSFSFIQSNNWNKLQA